MCVWSTFYTLPLGAEEKKIDLRSQGDSSLQVGFARFAYGRDHRYCALVEGKFKTIHVQYARDDTCTWSHPLARPWIKTSDTLQMHLFSIPRNPRPPSLEPRNKLSTIYGRSYACPFRRCDAAPEMEILLCEGYCKRKANG